MRHGKRINHLGRTASHRKAMLSNMATSLILHKRIFTTTAKAKVLRQLVEPLLTRSKEDTMHNRQQAFRYLQDKEAVTKLFDEVADKVRNRAGGYTRIIKTDNRLGDNAEMCMMELVDFNELLLAEQGKKKSTRRRRRGKKAEEAATVEATATAAEVTEDVETPEADREAPAETAAEVLEEAPAEESVAEATAEETPVAEEPAADQTPEEPKEDNDDEAKKAE